MGRVISAAAVQSKETVELARWLLGQTLVRTRGSAVTRALITEVEAYHGERDRASHASKGRTPRTEVMYGPGGQWYVYFIYGMHHMLNLVTGPAGHPAAVLIRGLDLVTGPGRLTRSLEIDRTLNGAAAHPTSGLHLEAGGLVIPRRLIRATPRIGVDYAGPFWAGKRWRFHFDPAALPPDALAAARGE